MTDAQQRIAEIRERIVSEDEESREFTWPRSDRHFLFQEYERLQKALDIAVDQITVDRQHIAELMKERDDLKAGYLRELTAANGLRAERDAAYQDGQIAMRGRCVHVAERHWDRWRGAGGFDGHSAGARIIYFNIRALQPEAKEQ